MKPKKIISLFKKYKPEKIILFGSHAYGKPGPNSDVDLVLIKKTNQPFLKRLKKVRSFLRSTTPFDIFVFTPKEFETHKQTNPLIAEIAQKGKIIYG